MSQEAAAKSALEEAMSEPHRVQRKRSNGWRIRQHKAEREYYEKITLPGIRRLQVIMMLLLQGRKVLLRWNPIVDTGHKLKNGAQYGKLIGFKNAFFLTVLPEGYKRPKTWHPSYWEPLRGERERRRG